MLWIDSAGLYYLLNANPNGAMMLIKYIYENSGGLKIGLLADGDKTTSKCRGGCTDRKAMAVLVFLAGAGLAVNCIWCVKHVNCDHVCVNKHELYTALCQCDPGEEFIIAQCNCTYGEGAVFQEGANVADCQKPMRCFCHLSCKK
ncbi:hypothetical protein [Pyrobaculum neutrophilum]|uniref:Uncharacterized protein n=1 Tax=Pyrobaculum neutrophilum (strain DSM 2338 / JCM 9278 / NBRC 100436 / V24Sta) TaxID=444157 RepID=B1Y8J7_PYRNV|nr:hypothetical protein [Pyrobaculum neutrophilum]ACB40076.1 hypothetical protein Tneu_1146 [Pyrobaculum neutrophilum V24Sta]